MPFICEQKSAIGLRAKFSFVRSKTAVVLKLIRVEFLGRLSRSELLRLGSFGKKIDFET